MVGRCVGRPGLSEAADGMYGSEAGCSTEPR